MSAAVETSIWNALKVRVEALSPSIVPQTSVAYPKQVFDPPADSTGMLPYIQVLYMPNQNERIMIPNGRKRRRLGILQLDVLEPIPRGLTAEQTIQQASLVAQHFPEGLVLRSGGVEVRIEREPDVGRGLEDGGYWRIPVSIRYECFA